MGANAPWVGSAAWVAAALVLVAINGFFVAAEFALVKLRAAQIAELIREHRPFAPTARWLFERLDRTLSACQLGITMASLALGWVGEPAFARLLTPIFPLIGVTSPAAIHTISFVVAFTFISGLHIVIGEQAPKIMAIRQPERIFLACAVPMKAFFLATYPLMVALDAATHATLGVLGLGSTDAHGAPASEAEIRTLVREAHLHGSLTRAEHSLINAVFEFDDMVCRKIMVPRSEVVFFDVNASARECLDLAARTKHTRYPICDGSLDTLLGVVHVKDLVGVDVGNDFDFQSIMRPPRKVPESVPTSRLLRHFQATHQLLAAVVDEYGTLTGIVTLENVLEQIIGPVDDEFDQETQNIVAAGEGNWVVLGSTPREELYSRLGFDVLGAEADTLSGLLVDQVQRLLVVGDRIEIGGMVAEVTEVRGDRAHLVRIRRADASDEVSESA